MTIAEIWEILAGPVGQVLGWVLLHFLWQGALVAASLFLALRLLHNQSPQTRYAVGCGALLLLLTMPLGTAVLLSGNGGLTEPNQKQLAPSEGSGQLLPSPSSTSLISWKTWGNRQLRSALPWIVLAWGLGALCCSARFVRGVKRNRQLRHSAEPAPDWWQKRLNVLAKRMGIDRSVSLKFSSSISVPMVVGWWRPILLVPIGFLSGLPPSQVEAIMLHELAHVRRHDVLVARIQATCETLFFYHPATWWISTQVRRSRENCCDDRVIESDVGRAEYARALVNLAEKACGPGFPAIRPTAGGGKLLNRVRRILGSDPHPFQRKHWSATLTALLLLICGVAGLARTSGSFLELRKNPSFFSDPIPVVLTQDSTGKVVLKTTHQSSPEHGSSGPGVSAPRQAVGGDIVNLDQRWRRVSTDSLLQAVRANLDFRALSSRLKTSVPLDVLRASLEIHPDTLERAASKTGESFSLSLAEETFQTKSQLDSLKRLADLQVHPDTLRRAIRKEVTYSLGRTLRENLDADSLSRDVKIRVALNWSDGAPIPQRNTGRPSPTGSRNSDDRLLAHGSDYVSQPDSLLSEAFEKTFRDTTIILGGNTTIIQSSTKESTVLPESG